MCIFRAPAPGSFTPPPAIAPRIEKDSTLPDQKDIVKEDDKSDVAIGGTAKKGAAKREGTAGLKIALNPGGAGGAKTGGVNYQGTGTTGGGGTP